MSAPACKVKVLPAADILTVELTLMLPEAEMRMLWLTE
jgi:hypothetical protein